MIALERQRTRAAVPQSFRGDRHRKNTLRLLRERRDVLVGREEKHDFDSGKWRVAKEQLLIETHQKCAYCEASTTSTGFGDVEHYRPKSVYWWLAYAYENYLASCAMCNQKFKKDKFEYLAGSRRMRAPTVRRNSSDDRLQTLSADAVPDPLEAAQVHVFENAHRGEKPAQINPYLEDPERHFAWMADTDRQEVELVARNGSAEARAKVDAAERIYGLNRSQLKRDRFFFYSPYSVFRDFLKNPGVPSALKTRTEKEVRAMQRADRPFAAMIRFFARKDGLPGL